MLKSDRVYLALGLVTTMGVTWGVSCGGTGNVVGSGGSGGSTSSSSTTSSSSSSTSSSSGMTCPPKQGTVLAVTKLSFGDGNSGEWKKVGFNIDGKVSTAASTDLCKPNAGGAASTVYPDGDQGIDNSFGKNLLPLVVGIDPTLVADTNNGLQNGFFTVLLKMYCLPPTGDAPVLVTKLFGGTALTPAPKFDGTDMWPVEPDLLSDPMDPESSTVVFAQSSVIGTTFDSGKNQQFILTIPVMAGGVSSSMKLTVYAARTTMTLSADRKSATGGIIGGVLNTEEFVNEVKKIGYLLNLCNNSVFPTIITQIRQASDILSDGTQDPTKTCDGISIGLGFEMKEVQLGPVGQAAAVGMACP